MIKLKRIIMLSIVCLLIIGFFAMFFISSGAGGNLSIVVRLTDPATGDQWQGEIDVSETVAQDLNIQGRDSVTLQPLSTHTATLYGVEPNTIYDLEFVVTANVGLPSEAPADTELYTDFLMYGETVISGDTYGFTNEALGQGGLETHDILTSPPDYICIGDFTKSNNLYWDSIYTGGGNYQAIRGSYIDGSTWTVEITSHTSWAGTDAYYGITTATIILEVDSTGNVSITVTDVGFTASEVGA